LFKKGLFFPYYKKKSKNEKIKILEEFKISLIPEKIFKDLPYEISLFY
jgi:hypothetical protein